MSCSPVKSVLLRSALVVLVTSFGITYRADAVRALDGSCGGSRPCACGDVVVASRTLVNGDDPITTTICPGRGLEVFAHRVDGPEPPLVLDLGGSTLRGAGEGQGILMSHSRGVTVRNGRVVGFASGIVAIEVEAGHIAALQLSGNETGIHATNMYAAGGYLIERCIVRGNAWDGIRVSGSGNTIRSCRAESNGYAGVAIDGNDNVVAHTMVSRNGWDRPCAGDGLVVSGARTLVDRNRSTYNAGAGIRVEGSDHTVVGNVTRGNSNDGFVTETAGSVFDRNNSSYNGGVGILDERPGAQNTYTRNRCTGNGVGHSEPAGLCR